METVNHFDKAQLEMMNELASFCIQNRISVTDAIEHPRTMQIHLENRMGKTNLGIYEFLKELRDIKRSKNNWTKING